MKMYMKTISIATAAIALVLILTFTIQKLGKDESVVQVEKEIDQIQKSARNNHPDLPVTIAFHKEAQKRTTEKLTKAATDSEKMTIAANHFFGFYFINTRARKQFCQQHGVDINTFIKLFSDSHNKEFAKARSIYTRIGANEEKVWLQIRAAVDKIVAQDMHDTSSVNNMTLQQTCKALVEKAEVVVPDMHFSKSSPAVFQVLSQVQIN